jgi:hypothetical protein
MFGGLGSNLRKLKLKIPHFNSPKFSLEKLNQFIQMESFIQIFVEHLNQNLSMSTQAMLLTQIDDVPNNIVVVFLVFQLV